VVLLAGTFDYQVTSELTGHFSRGTARFEIRMRGADYYYAERWTGHQRKRGSWDALTLSLPQFSGRWNRSYAGTGHKGRGGSAPSSDDTLLVARRLWRGDEFIGAAAADEFSLRGATERFSRLKHAGRFHIPQRIEWSDGNRREVLHVRRVELLNEPGTNWFAQIQQKYFGDLEDRARLRGTNLDEAGWAAQEAAARDEAATAEDLRRKSRSPVAGARRE
jgi:hypothetical protein